MLNNIIITIDGSTASGKTTIARLLSQKYSLFHIRGGTYFRTLTYAIIDSNINYLNESMIVNFAKNLQIEIDYVNNYQIYYKNKNITSLLHTQKINDIVPFVSSYREIRKMRKKWAIKISKNHNIIVDGRTFGSEVFPNATLKFYLDSEIAIRIIRRAKETNQSLSYISNSIIARDTIDHESYIDKLKIPQDAYYIDSTFLSIDETFLKMSHQIKGLV